MEGGREEGRENKTWYQNKNFLTRDTSQIQPADIFCLAPRVIKKMWICRQRLKIRRLYRPKQSRFPALLEKLENLAILHSRVAAISRSRAGAATLLATHGPRLACLACLWHPPSPIGTWVSTFILELQNHRRSELEGPERPSCSICFQSTWGETKAQRE